MKQLILKIDSVLDPLRAIAERHLSPALDLVIRLYMANIFFVSGWGKFKNFLNGDWGTTIFLFEEVHPLPFLSPDIAAILGTGGELALPVLLAAGLFSRFAAAGLLAMTLAIQFLVPADYGIMNDIHYLWMLLLAIPLIKGPGPLSLDYILLRFLKK